MNPRTVNFLNRYHKTPSYERNKLSYLAGLLDGEGYIKVEQWGTVRVVIGMTNKKVIQWCHNNFGGTLDHEQTLKSGKKFYVWRLTKSLDTLKLLILLYPFLIVKKKKVLEALNILQNRLVTHKDFYNLKGLKLN